MKIVLLGGAGEVGSTAAFSLLAGTEGFDIVLVDPRDNVAVSHVMDLEQVIQLGGSGSIRRGDAQEIVDAEVVVMTASVPLRPNDSRSVFLGDNAATLSEAAEILKGIGSSWHGMVIVVTNPVDALCTWLLKQCKMERGRLIGYVLNDSLRFQKGVSLALNVQVESVGAWSIGEHGAHCVPLFSRVTVADEPVVLTLEQRNKAEDFLRTWYVRHVALNAGRTTNWTSGLGLARMVRAIANPTEEIWPASVVLDGEYGISGVSVGVPVRLGRHGVEHVHRWDLEPREQDSRLRNPFVRQQTLSVPHDF